ncbi:MAG TPA: hypothetical protein VM870_07040 [Pyrinomonadaceae bacterium]|jgi:hypothetical protein|nr:hypothetical protein [Pyrinomonadaceae bacterium]
MSARLTVIFFILLCLEAGIVLTFMPWVHPFGLSDWGDNYFLLYAARRTGLQGLQHAVSSGWIRGAVTGLGVLNIIIALWEAAHFRQTVRALQGFKKEESLPPAKNAPPVINSPAPNAAYLPHHERTNHPGHHPEQ